MDLNAWGRQACGSASTSTSACAGMGSARHGAAPEEMKTGTTIVSCKFKGGVIIGADSRVSVGAYTASRAAHKLMELTDNIFLARSGSCADTQAVGDYVRYFADQLSGELGVEPSVKSVAQLVAMMNYNNKEMLVGAMIVAGWDKTLGGQVYGIPLGGTLVEEEWTCDGSGSTYIWGYMDSAWKPDMTHEEAEAFVVEALALAMTRDASSGGVIRMVTLSQAGASWKFIDGNDVPLFDEEKGLRPAPAATSMAVG